MKKKNLLILYFPLDDPAVSDPFELLEIYKQHGTSVIEIALPTENPILDGKTIRDSMARVLQFKTLEEYFEDIGKVSAKYPKLKIQLMAYYHLIEKFSIEKFAEKVKKCGVSYVLSPDAEPEKIKEMEMVLCPLGISVIRIAPCILRQEEVKLFRNSKGYIFQRTSNGKTGETHEFSGSLQENTKLLRENGINTPVVYAFGISEKKQVVQAMKMGADGVVIGSALFSYISDGTVHEYLSNFDEWFKD